MIFKGWKEIANYLGVSTKQARRWEIIEDLPILRPSKRPKGPVFAEQISLDKWIKRNN